MSETPSVPPIVNKIMKFVLRSQMHGVVSKTVLLLTFSGRKSGKTYTTPVSYSLDGNKVTIFTHAGWWKNLHSGTPITLRIQGLEYQGLPEVVASDKKLVATGLMDHLRKVPTDAKYYGVTFDKNGNPRAEEVEKAAQTVVMVITQLC